MDEAQKSIRGAVGAVNVSKFLYILWWSIPEKYINIEIIKTIAANDGSCNRNIFFFCSSRPLNKQFVLCLDGEDENYATNDKVKVTHSLWWYIYCVVVAYPQNKW